MRKRILQADRVALDFVESVQEQWLVDAFPIRNSFCRCFRHELDRQQSGFSLNGSLVFSSRSWVGSFASVHKDSLRSHLLK
jgi:hypothetical protein